VSVAPAPRPAARPSAALEGEGAEAEAGVAGSTREARLDGPNRAVALGAAQVAATGVGPVRKARSGARAGRKKSWETDAAGTRGDGAKTAFVGEEGSP
jgi:hypothetical protein